jgi:hypothetical protein
MRLRHACFLLRTRYFTLGKDVHALTPGQDPTPSVHVEDVLGGYFARQRFLSARSVPETTKVDRH